MRASEIGEQTLNRQELDKVRKASMRASETCEQTLNSRTEYVKQAREPLKHVNRLCTDKSRKECVNIVTGIG